MKLFKTERTWEIRGKWGNIRTNQASYYVLLCTKKKFRWPYLIITIWKPRRWLKLEFKLAYEYKSPIFKIHIVPISVEIAFDTLPF